MRRIWVMPCSSVRTIAQYSQRQQGGEQQPEESPRRTLFSITDSSTFNPLQQHIPKTLSSKSWTKALNLSHKSHQSSVLAGRGRERQRERGQGLSSTSFSLHSPCGWAHQLPFRNTMFFVPCVQELMQLLCISFTLVFLCRPFFAFITSALPPCLLPSFSSARSHWLCISPFSERGCQTWLCLGVFTLPPLPPFPTALSFHKEEEGIFLLVLLSAFPLLFLFCHC